LRRVINRDKTENLHASSWHSGWIPLGDFAYLAELSKVFDDSSGDEKKPKPADVPADMESPVQQHTARRKAFAAAAAAKASSGTQGGKMKAATTMSDKMTLRSKASVSGLSDNYYTKLAEAASVGHGNQPAGMTDSTTAKVFAVKASSNGQAPRTPPAQVTSNEPSKGSAGELTKTEMDIDGPQPFNIVNWSHPNGGVYLRGPPGQQS
jgi:hypothetical protein